MTFTRILNWKFPRVASLVTFLTILSSFSAFATTNYVVLGWDANTETNLSGYAVYYGTASRNYSASKDVSSAFTSTTITNLQPGTNYYFAVTAKNTLGLESGYSPEVSCLVPVAVNNPPVANAQSIAAVEDTAKAITLTGSDADGNALTYTIVSNPTRGTLGGSGASRTYTPAANYNGSDSFTFKVNDGTADSATATVTISIAPVNDVPMANAQTVAVVEDTAKAITLAGTDIDGDALTFQVVTSPTKGSLSGTAPNLTYTPNANVNGSDSLTFRAYDGVAYSAAVTVTISIAAVNDAPVAINQNVAAVEDTAKAITLTGSDVDGNTLTYSIVSSPANGILSGSAPNLTYTPAANFSGNDTFTFRVSDGTASSPDATVYVSVAAVNDAPIANAQSIAVLEDTAKALTLTGSDVEGSALTFTVASQPTKGTLSGTAPNLTYLSNTNYFGSDSFTFTVSDGVSNSAPATITLNIAQVNQTPVANAQSVTTLEDTAKSITLAGSDPDNNPLTYVIVTAPTQGALSGVAPALTYTPAANYSGSDSFTFKVNDGKADSSVATVSVSVTAVNDVPVANGQSVAVVEDTAKPITLVGSDVEGSTLSYTILTAPSKGTLSGVAPSLIYTPAANLTGADGFTFRVNDGTADSPAATVSINISPLNDAPIAQSQAVSTLEDIAKSITLAASDVDGDALTYTVVAAPVNGTLTGTAPNLTYRPATNFNGNDSFTFKANDGTVDSGNATVLISIGAVNDAPTAIAQSVGTDRNVAAPVTLSGADVDGDRLTFAVATQPTKGTLSGTAPNLTYTPNNNVTGTDSFTFTTSDGSLTSVAVTISINIAQGPNTIPVAIAQSVGTAEDTAKAITLTGSDADDNALTFAVVAAPTKGTLNGTAPNLTYTPVANYNGSDSFTFKVNDGAADSATATVSLTVSPVNDAPVAGAQSVTTIEDTAKAIQLAGSDVDGDNLSFAVMSQPSKGTLSGVAPALTYTPNADVNGADSFMFRVSDGTTNSATATVSISITPANDLPSAIAQSVATVEDTAKSITLAGTDIDGNTLTYAIVSAPTRGTLTGTGATRTYTPAANFSGDDSFTFKVNDGTADSTPATVSITVTPANDTPIADAQSVTTQEDAAKVITLTGSDPDGDTLTFALVTSPAKGMLSGTAPNLTYLPGTNYQGADSFTFRVNDGTTNSATATVSITVTPSNDQPVAIDQSLTTAEDTAEAIMLSATDADGDALTYTVVTPPANGTLSGTGASRTYTPNANFNGSDSFWFKASDPTSDSALVVVNITVTPVNDIPTAAPIAVATEKNVPKVIALTGSDLDGDALTFNYTQPSKGVLSGTPPGLTYTPNNNVTGADSFTFTAKDASATSPAATVSITIAPGPNTVPAAIAQSISTAEDATTAITLTGSDVDGDTLSFTVTAAPMHGTLTGTAPNLVYKPATNYFGEDTLWFKVNDGTVDSSLAVISLTVTPVNDAPVANAQSVAAVENVAKAVVLTGSDVEASPLTFSVVTSPAHGTLTGTAPNLTYTATKGYSGADSLTFRVNDGTTDSATATVSITVSPAPNIVPVAVAQTISAAEDAAATITLAGTDADEDPLTYSVVTAPTKGTLSGTAPNLTYTPSTNYSGGDSFTFRVNDGEANSPTATVSITVTPVNDTPLLNAVADVRVSEGSAAKSVALSGIAAGGGESQALVVTATSSNPSLIPIPAISYASPSATGTLTFTPVATGVGSSVITVTVNDGQSQNNTVSQSFTVTVEKVVPPLTIDPIADITIDESAPQQTVALTGITSKEVASTSDSWFQNTLNRLGAKATPAIVVTAATSDPNLIPTPVVAYTSPNDNGTLSFAPVAGKSGSANLSVTVADGVNTPVTRTFKMIVLDINQAPALDVLPNLTVAKNSGNRSVPFGGISAGAGESQTLVVTVTSSNPGLIPQPTVSYTSPSANGSLTLAPVKDASGSAVITVRVDDGGTENNITSRSFTVTVPSETTAPSLVLTQPTVGGSYTAPGTITIEASVTDNAHTIDKVQFFSSATLLGEATAAPYKCFWDCDTAATYSLVARATYDGGLTIDSPTVSITVAESGLPQPWDAGDIGALSASGKVKVQQDRYTVEGAGRVGGTDDSCSFVHQPLTADGEIWVNLANLPSTGDGSSAGIMIRESLSSASRFVYLAKLPDGNLQICSRSSTGGSTTTSLISGGKPADWIRLVRKGDLFVAGYGKKAGSWSAGSMINVGMAPNIYVGLAVTSGDPGTLSQVTFVAPAVNP